MILEMVLRSTLTSQHCLISAAYNSYASDSPVLPRNVLLTKGRVGSMQLDNVPLVLERELNLWPSGSELG
jgi:hypothetical protein